MNPYQEEVGSLLEALEDHPQGDILKQSLQHCIAYGDTGSIAYSLCVLKGVPAHSTVVPYLLLESFVLEFQQLYPRVYH